MTTRIPVDRSRSFRMAGVLVGLAVVLGACAHHEEVTASIPDDYRQRHPIAIQEADRSVVIFVGHGRGGLSASERSDVVGLAQSWLHEGTGTIVADVPVKHAQRRGSRRCLPGNPRAAGGGRRAAARDYRPPLSSG